jgi:predicted Zn-ribbon and HTH transcriptional regulator
MASPALVLVAATRLGILAGGKTRCGGRSINGSTVQIMSHCRRCLSRWIDHGRFRLERHTVSLH